MAVEFITEQLQTNNGPLLPFPREEGTTYSPCRLLFKDPKSGKLRRDLETRAGFIGEVGSEENRHYLFVKFPDLVQFTLEETLFRQRLVIAVSEPITKLD